jgi:hypothetical protein
MTQATRVYITPPINTSADTTRRRILTIAAAGSIAGFSPAMAVTATSPRQQEGINLGANETNVLAPKTSSKEITPSQGIEGDPAFALIAEKLAADVAHCEAIDVQDKADVEHGSDSQAAWEANDRCEAAGHAVNVVDWRLARTPPTTFAGVAAVLRFANEIEDRGMEWPQTDTVGPDGWHYQLRATMAAAIEAIIRQMGV